MCFHSRRIITLVLTAALSITARSTEPDPAHSAFPDPPATPTGSLRDMVVADIEAMLDSLPSRDPDIEAIGRLGGTDDPRLAWLFSDLLRFVPVTSPLGLAAADAWIATTGVSVAKDRAIWATTTNHLLAWDTPAPPGYRGFKAQIFELIELGWIPFFADEDADIDWRWLSWGGVLIDDRPLHLTALDCPESCIPALDDPGLVRANTAEDWLADDRVVFAIELNGDAVAVPKNMMEVHEMINMTIGGRRVGFPTARSVARPRPISLTTYQMESRSVRPRRLSSARAACSRVPTRSCSSSTPTRCSTRSQELPLAVRFKTPAWYSNR